MTNWGHKLNNPMITFTIEQELGRSGRSLWLRLTTNAGSKDIWLPMKLIDVLFYHKDDSVISEVLVPEWFAIKTGLIEDGT